MGLVSFCLDLVRHSVVWSSGDLPIVYVENLHPVLNDSFTARKSVARRPFMRSWVSVPSSLFLFM